MPLPPDLENSLRASYPALQELSDDLLLKLQVCVAFDSDSVSLQRLSTEKRQGITTYTDELRERREFRIYMKRMLEYNLSLPRHTGKRPKRSRGRPADTEVALDRRIVQAWNTKQYRTYAALARELYCTPQRVAAVVDKHRKRNAAE